MTGVVKWYDDDKGYGFLVRADSAGDVFVHYTAIESQSDGWSTLSRGQAVEFNVVPGPKGPAAANVRVIRREAV